MVKGQQINFPLPQLTPKNKEKSGKKCSNFKDKTLASTLLSLSIGFFTKLDNYEVSAEHNTE